MENLAKRYKRWRHTRGFGVHSPLSFALLNAVVRPGHNYGYYGYTDIRHAAVNNRGGEERDAQMLLRLAAFLKAEHAYLPPHSGALYATALRGANSKIVLHRGIESLSRCQLVCSSGDHVPLAKLCQYIAEPGRAIALRDIPEGWRDALFDSLNEGVMMHGQKNVIILSRSMMQKISYSINL